jgi:hypothetical protein
MRLGLSLASTRIPAVLDGGLGLLRGEEQGFAIDATMLSGNGSLAVADTGTPANDRLNVSLYDSTSPLTNAGTSPKLVNVSDGTLEWSPHNRALYSEDFSNAAWTTIAGGTVSTPVKTADAGAVSYLGDITKGVYALRAQINRGSVPTTYLPTTTAAVIGVPVSYDIANSQYGILSEPAATNLQVYAFYRNSTTRLGPAYRGQ